MASWSCNLESGLVRVAPLPLWSRFGDMVGQTWHLDVVWTSKSSKISYDQISRISRRTFTYHGFSRYFTRISRLSGNIKNS